MTGMFAVVAGYSQTNTGKSAGNTGIVEPTINGKPYSQYKAEQQALNQQRIAQTKVVLFADVPNNGGTVETKTAPVENQENSGAKTTPVSHKLVITESNATVSPVQGKTQSIQQEKGDGAVTNKVAEASKVKVEARTESNSNAVVAPQPLIDASKTSNGNGSSDTKEVKSTDQKPVETKEPAGNSPSTNKTKTD